MKKFWRIRVLAAMGFFMASPLSYAADNKILLSPIVQETISVIERNYAWPIDKALLEKNCLLGAQEEDEEESTVDSCLAMMVSGLDGRSTYYSKKRIVELGAKVATKQVETISTDMLLDGRVAYVEINQFLKKTSSAIASTLSEVLLKSTKLSGLVIDLRDCSGGVLGYAIDSVGLFLQDKALIGSAESGKVPPKVDVYVTPITGFGFKQNPPTLKTLPIVILVGAKTAGGAEFFASALNENGRAIVVGAETAKKGDLQAMIVLPGGRGLKLTTQFLLTPKRRSISLDGVAIDVHRADVNVRNLNHEDDPLIKQAVMMFP